MFVLLVLLLVPLLFVAVSMLLGLPLAALVGLLLLVWVLGFRLSLLGLLGLGGLLGLLRLGWLLRILGFGRLILLLLLGRLLLRRGFLSSVGFGHQRLQVNFLRVVIAVVVSELVILVVFLVLVLVVGVFYNWGSLLGFLDWHGNVVGVAIRFSLLQIDLILALLVFKVTHVFLDVAVVIRVVLSGSLAGVLAAIDFCLVKACAQGLRFGRFFLFGVVFGLISFFLAIEHVVVHVVSLGLKVAAQVDFSGALCQQGHVLRAVDVQI